MARIRRILYSTDFSKASGAAFTKSVELAKANHAELVLLHVLVPPVLMIGEGYVSPKVYQDLYASSLRPGVRRERGSVRLPWRRRLMAGRRDSVLGERV